MVKKTVMNGRQEEHNTIFQKTRNYLYYKKQIFISKLLLIFNNILLNINKIFLYNEDYIISINKRLDVSNERDVQQSLYMGKPNYI